MSKTRVQVTVSDDKMSVTVGVVAGSPSEMSELIDALKAAGVSFGIDQRACRRVGGQLADPEFEAKDVIVASGDPGKPGVDSEIKLLYESNKNTGARRSDGSIDFRERFKVYRAEPDDLLARYKKATKGINGSTIDGESIDQKDGVVHRPTIGKSVSLDPETLEIHAKQAGMICYVENQSMHVLDLFEHNGDVDYDSGNLRIEGALMITGEVKPNFLVEAGGDLIVQGKQVAGDLTANGNILVEGGIAFEVKGSVEATGDVACHHASNCKIESGNILRIEDHALDSELRARQILLNNGRGRLIGGVARAVDYIEVVEAGSVTATKTRLVVGKMTPKQAMAERRLPEAQQRSPARIELDLMLAAKIVITGRLHPGVIIQFGRKEHTVVEEMRDVMFRYSQAADRIVWASRSD